ncbi:hypothetical protein GCK32_013806 [Trichostrongylus colubriformis]|uniref:Uncharacterized protein n=1 Tax=Trichostrongylus colubriformis TaxID=6319 RepID=A0AAN8FGU2_TRICO
MDNPSDSVPDRVRHRRFLVLDRHVEDEDGFHIGKWPTMVLPGQFHERFSDHPELLDSLPPTPFLRAKKDEDQKSELSFIMKERLHTMAKEVQRRTSAVRESLIREIPEDSFSTTSMTATSEEQQPSLMSLIGLQKDTEGDADDEDKWRCRLPETLHPYGRSILHDMAVPGDERISIQCLLHSTQKLLSLPNKIEPDILADTGLYL